MAKKTQFTKEQQERFLSLAGDDKQLKAIKRMVGVTDPISPANEQIVGSASLKEYKGHGYVATDFVKLGEKESAKGVFVRKEIARMVAEEILRFCDENNL
jgi:hypothetical protein